MLIHKGDTFINDNGEMVQLNAPHFGDYAVSIYHYNEETEDFDIHDRDTIYTAAEIRRLANAKSITWKEEDI